MSITDCGVVSASSSVGRRAVRATSALAAALLLAAPALAAGNVVAAVKGTTLSIKGDDGANVLTLTTSFSLKGQSSGASVRITPDGNTTINGVAGAADFSGVINVTASLGEGADDFTCDTFAIDGSLTVKGSDGDDVVVLQDSTIGTDLKVVGGTGTLTMELTHSDVDRNLSIKGGPGADSVAVAGSHVDGSTSLALGPGNNSLLDNEFSDYNGPFKFTAGPGDDTLTVNDASFETSASIKLGPGSNLLTCHDASTGEQLVCKGGGNDDVVTLLGTAVGTDCHLSLAAGLNSVLLDKFDFDPGPGSATTLIGEQLTITGGGGNDTVTVTGGTLVGDSCRIGLAAGDNVMAVTDCGIGEDLVIKTGGGDDSLDLTGAVVGDQTNVNLGGGQNTGP